MRLSRIYQQQSLSIGNEIVLDTDASHYVSRVLRTRIGQKLCLFNGDGHDYIGEVSKINHTQVYVQLESRSQIETEPRLQIHLGLALSKSQSMDYAIQKAVELGVSQITPLLSDFSNFKADETRQQKKQQHWQKVIISAAEQSGHKRLPKLHPIAKLHDWVQQHDYGLFLDPEAKLGFMSLPQPQTLSIALLSGPEGGFSDDEVQYLKSQPHFSSVRLGPYILRAETAPVAALSLIQVLWGNY